MTGDDKVALLLGSLPPQAVEPILARLDPAVAARVRARLQQPPPAGGSVAEIAREFTDINRITAREVPAPASAPPETPPVNPTDPDDPIAALREFPPAILAAALLTERAATVALALGFLDVPQASAVLKQLPPEVRLEAVARQMQPSPLKPELVQRVLSVVQTRCRQLADAPTTTSDDDRILRMSELIRRLVTDLLRVDDRTVQAMLGNMDVKTLALALKSAGDDTKNKVLNNISRRARDNVEEEMELLANPQPSQVDEAQGQIIDFLRRLDEEGNLPM